ncbi:hypothetical protein HY449_04590 [Candidatus Pacearchaeota archaeon]|nr:hypothetical protein [Candidatus Pacearchaeota archaeon]
MNFTNSFIFIGDTHGFLNDFEKQKEVIERYNPEYVLAESLEDINLESEKNYQNISYSKKISNMTSFSIVKDLIELCHIKGIKLIGIDFKNFGFNENLQHKIINQQEPSLEEKEEINKIVIERENKHSEMLQKYKNKSIKPIVVILGAWHLRNGSPIFKDLNNYKLIFPCDKEGNIIFEPTDKKISWCERIKGKKY